MGQGPETTEDGDMICIILGCPVPMVLRPVMNHCPVVGEAYMHGIMHGEVMPALEQGTAELREFELR